MDLQHSGSDRILLKVETDDVVVEIAGLDRKPQVQQADRYSASLAIDSDSPIRSVVYDSLELISSDTDRLSYSGLDDAQYKTPLFFENQEYVMSIYSKHSNDVDWLDSHYVYHENASLCDSIRPLSHVSVFTGRVNFQNQIGLSTFELRRKGKYRDETVLSFTIEVFPTKLDYQTDYQNLKEDISEIYYSLIFSMLEKTFSNDYTTSREHESTKAEYYSIISAIFDKLLKAIDVIIQRPHHELDTVYEMVPPHKFRRSDRKTRKWMMKHPDCIRYESGELDVNGKILNARRIVNYATRENKFAKYIITNVLSKLVEIRRLYNGKSESIPNPGFDQKINDMIHRLNSRIQGSFLNELPDEPMMFSMSLVFSMAPGYRELYRYYLALQMGLVNSKDITDILYRISLKDLAVLYEYWCFIKLNSIMQERYRLKQVNGIKYSVEGLYATLVMGRIGKEESNVVYETEDNDIITLKYNQKFRESTVNQKPDNLFVLHRSNTVTDWQFVFDAKYRVATDGSGRFSAEPDAINTMHRYRDALLIEEDGFPKTRRIVGAYVLFPYPGTEDEFMKTNDYKNIDKVNIGAFPFLPGKTGLLESFLDKIVLESPEKMFYRSPMPAGWKEYLHTDSVYSSTEQDCIMLNPDVFYSIDDAFADYSISEERSCFRINRNLVDDIFFRYVAYRNSDGWQLARIIDRREILTYYEDRILWEYAFVPVKKSPDGLPLVYMKDISHVDRPYFISSYFIMTRSISFDELRSKSTEEHDLIYALNKLQRGVVKPTDETKVETYSLKDSKVSYTDGVFKVDGVAYRSLDEALRNI